MDLTARDLQLQAKKVGQIVDLGESLILIDYAQEGNPWDLSKGCELTNIIESAPSYLDTVDCSGPVGKLVPKESLQGDLSSKELRLHQNGELRQSSKLSNMIWGVPDIISVISSKVKLEPGDVIFTGTPAGVGPISRGDKIEASCSDLPLCSFTVE